MKRRFNILSLLTLIAVIFAACAAPASAPADTAAESAGDACASVDQATLQLKWVAQAQFAGYYAAEAQGFYAEECLELTINPGGPDIVPEQVVAGGQADFGINFIPSLLSAREQGTNLVNIAQIFERSAMREISWVETGIESPADLSGKAVAVWFGGNEFELLATLNKYEIDTDSDVELIQQPFDMNLLLQREVDAAAAMTYNELAQILEVINPETGELHQLEELNVIDFNEEGTAMLQDGVFVTEDWLADEANHDIAERFLRASFRGWMHCRDNPDQCVDAVLEQGPALPRGHQTWMMNEVNALIWPASGQIGVMDPDLFQQTADIALTFGVIENPASSDAYNTTFAEAALAGMEGDSSGAGWTRAEIELTEGGQ